MAAKNGDTVHVHYTGKLDDGTVFDSSRNGDPIQFTIGEKRVIPGFENGVVGLGEGESKRIIIPPDEAYGDRQEDAVVTVPRERLPEDITLEIGMVLSGQTAAGPVTFTIVGLEGDQVTVDGNHPLAGKTLHFEVELVGIQET
jgi:peptidylprolyl isomerase